LIELGGNIILVGFKELDYTELIVVKKVVGNYARKMSDVLKNFENLTVTMKAVHKTPKSQKYEIHAKLMAGGKPHTSELVERNLFVAIDLSLKKVLSSISK
jgi:ribosome-associated translation inhibitor RaiA|tara:strand:- start:151 stop:453 length:303 start_codon:yes stop_codon:yes gene_type:complete